MSSSTSFLPFLLLFIIVTAISPTKQEQQQQHDVHEQQSSSSQRDLPPFILFTKKTPTEEKLDHNNFLLLRQRRNHDEPEQLRPTQSQQWIAYDFQPAIPPYSQWQMEGLLWWTQRHPPLEAMEANDTFRETLGHEDDDREDEIVDIVHSPTLRQEEEGDGDTVDEDGDETSSDGTTLSENTSGIQAPPTLITATRANDEFHKDSNKVKYNSGNHDDDNPSHPVTATDLGQPNSTHAAQQPPPPSSSPFDQDVDEHSYKKVLQSSSSSLESELKSNKEEILNDKYQYHPAEEDTTLLLGDSIIVTDDHTEDGSATTNNNDGMNHPHRSITTPVIKEIDDKEEEDSERRNVRDIVMQDEGERGNDVTTIDVVEDGDETALLIDDISSDMLQRRSSTEETSSSSSSSPDAMTTTITSTTAGGGEQKINIQYDDPSTLSSSSNTINKDANREFVTGLDDVDKLFESVEVPDELDVGADGSSMQEVLVGQALKIIMKKVKGLGGIIKLKFDKVAMPVVKKALPQLGLFGGEDDEGDDTDFDAVLFESLVNGSDEEKMTSLTIDKKEEGVVTSAAAAAAKNLNDKLKNVRDKVKEVPLFKSDETQRVFKFTTKKLEQGKQMFNNLLSIFEGEEEDEDVVNFDLSNMNLDDILSLDKGTQP